MALAAPLVSFLVGGLAEENIDTTSPSGRRVGGLLQI